MSATVQTAETWGDKARAVAYALLVHILCIGLMFVGLLWTRTVTPPMALVGPVIEAELVGPAAAPKPPRAAARKPAPPKPQPVQPPEPKPETPAEPQRTDAINRERIAELAIQKAEEEKRAQEERRKQEQIELKDEQKREAAERERLKQLEDIKRQREAAEKKRKLEEQRLAQLKDLEKQPKPAKPTPQEVAEGDQARTGMGGQATGLQAEYFAAIQNAVTQNWLRPDTAAPGLRCAIRIVQIPGGDVLTAEISSPCNADAQTRTSIEQAVRRAAPLPYKGYEKVFQRDLRFNFTYDG